MKKQFSKITVALAVLSFFGQAHAEIDMARMIKNYNSPNGIIESCIALAKLPMGHYKEGDLREEQKLCAINFNDDATALCSKTWSTSPATIVTSFRNVDGKDMANSAE